MMRWLDFATYAALIAIGIGIGWLMCWRLFDKKRQVLSNWEAGMIIDTHDGERLYVCHVEPTPSGSEGPDG